MPGDDRLTRADIEFHDATAHLYEETLEPLFRPYTELLDSLLDSFAIEAPGRKALDIGCGTGLMTMRLAQRGFLVWGVDHSPAMLEIAGRHARTRGFAERIELQIGDVRSLPFEAESFDAVTCQGVLHHLQEMRTCVSELERVLRPGGVFYIAEPCQGSTAAIRGWGRLTRLVRQARTRFLGGRRRESAPPSRINVPEHEEGPIDADELSASLQWLGLHHACEFCPYLDGLHRVRPKWLQRALLLLAWRPWRHRSGNMVLVHGRKPLRPPYSPYGSSGTRLTARL